MCLEDNIQSNFRIPYIPPPQQPLFMASTTSWQTLCIYVKSHFYANNSMLYMWFYKPAFDFHFMCLEDAP